MNLVKAIDKRLASMERNKLWLCRKSGVSKGALYTFMKGHSELKVSSLELIAGALGVKLSTLIEEAEASK